MREADRLRIAHLCFADGEGGAAIGARRLHRAMLGSGLDSRLYVVRKKTDDPTVIEIPRSAEIRQRIGRRNDRLRAMHRTGNPVVRSFNLTNTGAADFLNAQNIDILQMHWVGADTLSIAEIARLRHPVVWKLPDMFPFSGTEHYPMPDDPERWRDGYTRTNRPAHESGPDLNRWIWLAKRRLWRNSDFAVVGPSRWLTGCARDSVLFGHRTIRHILNPLDIDVYRPAAKVQARAAFGLPQDKRLVMFGTLAATTDRRKGFHHLQAILDRLAATVDPAGVALVVFGACGEAGTTVAGFDVHYLGTILDESRLAFAYAAADVFVFPSEMDNLPNVVKEATCCGIPSAGFAIGGMPDMVDHLETGYLAQPFDTDELAAGILWLLERIGPALNEEVRRRAALRHDPATATARYLDLYRTLIAARRARPDAVA